MQALTKLVLFVIGIGQKLDETKIREEALEGGMFCIANYGGQATLRVGFMQRDHLVFLGESGVYSGATTMKADGSYPSQDPQEAFTAVATINLMLQSKGYEIGKAVNGIDRDLVSKANREGKVICFAAEMDTVVTNIIDILVKQVTV